MLYLYVCVCLDDRPVSSGTALDNTLDTDKVVSVLTVADYMLGFSDNLMTLFYYESMNYPS